MNAKVEQKERSHESILQSAARLVREKGISGAGDADVMKGAALTVGGLYAHFSSKDELVDETLRRPSATGRAREPLFHRREGWDVDAPDGNGAPLRHPCSRPRAKKPEAARAEVILER